jgi:hypothetical protein
MPLAIGSAHVGDPHVETRVLPVLCRKPASRIAHGSIQLKPDDCR